MPPVRLQQVVVTIFVTPVGLIRVPIKYNTEDRKGERADEKGNKGAPKRSVI